jgi:predicted nucleic acid-binding protein
VPVSERLGSVSRLPARHRRVAIDSSALIYLTEGDPVRAEPVARVVDAVAAGEIDGSISTIALAEVLVGPARSGETAAFERLAATILDLGLRIVPLDASVAEDAAWIRGRSGMAMPDAIVIASARAAEATVLLTNDRGIAAQPRLDIVYVDDLVGV